MALRNQPFFPFYVQDFMADEKLANCSAESTGVYIRLMCVLHKMEDYGAISLKEKEKQTENNVKNFAIKLSRQMPYGQDIIERSLAELLDEGVIELEGDRLFQKRMVRDAKISKIRAEAAAKGKKGCPKDDEDIYGKQDDSQIKQVLNTVNENEIEDAQEHSEVDQSDITDEFNLFWEAYPKKVAKGAARKKFFKIAPKDDLFQKIMAALSVVKESEQWKKDRGKFIPYPSTWLNQERWEDEYWSQDIVASKSSNFDPENPYDDWSG